MKQPTKHPSNTIAPNTAEAGDAAPGPLMARLVPTLHPSAAERGQKRLEEWLDEADSQSLRAIVKAYPAVGTLLAGLADGSPFLWHLATAEPERLRSVLESDPERRLPEILTDTAAAVSSSESDAEAMRLLRRMKSEAALLIGLADVGGLWPVMRTTRAITDLADTAAASAVRFLLAQAARQGRLDPPHPDHPDVGSGYIVLAMGKMGAGELNYSSDIDLIVFYERETPALTGDGDAGSFYVRITRGLVKLLQERTPDGYVFRVDLRLRPDPASTQAAVSVDSGLEYYGSVGQNWERAAMIKARPCAGDIVAGEAMLRQLSPFIWRKYLDFAAVADIEAMKRQIHAYRGHDDIAVEGHNIKLGRGGIREIEFFAQTQQLIAGGRHPELRGRETLATLDTLVEGGWIDREACHDLTDAYNFLRTIEHRLQMVADEQTHTLPSDSEEFARFARFAGYRDRDDFAAALLGHLRKVQRHYAQLFEEMNALDGAAQLVFPADADHRETLDKLGAMGFRKPLEVSAIVRGWLENGTYPSLRGDQARAQFAELIPLLLDRLSRSENSDAALMAFDRFLAGLHGGGRLFALLKQNPDLTGLIAMMLGTAPRLAEILARYPEAMDALLDPSFFGALPGESKLSADIGRTMGEARSYEDLLDRLRLFGQEQMFLIGARILSGTASAEQSAESFAQLADVILLALHHAVEARFAEQHGRIAGQSTALVALGKLGGREMTATSDLDLMIMYDFDQDQPQSDGSRSLYGAQYFARLTQRIISALSAQTNYGSLYEVDMRLRPSGRSGPVATLLDSFRDYQENEAWTWEHMALTRARVVSGPPEFVARVEAAIREVLCRERDTDLVAEDVVEMRRAIAREKGDKTRWDLKYVAGGLVDLEFIAQHLQLIHAHAEPDILDTNTARVFDKALRLGFLSAEDADVLRPAARLYHNLTQILRLCLSGPFDAKSAGSGLLGLLARAGDVPDFATLDAHLTETQERVRAAFTRILGRAP